MERDKLEWQGYDELGQPVAAISKKQAGAGALHGAAHVWIYRLRDGKIEVLLQRRSPDIKTWPGRLDTSAAGHVDAGETPIKAALRETREELGIELDETQLHLLFVNRQNITTKPNGYIENEFQWVYGVLYEFDVLPGEKSDEVSDIEWLALDEYQALALNDVDEVLSPQGDNYVGELVASIRLIQNEDH